MSTGFGTDDARRGRRVPGAPADRPSVALAVARRRRRSSRTAGAYSVPRSPCRAAPRFRWRPSASRDRASRRTGGAALLRQMMDEQLDDVAPTRRAARRAHRVGGVDLRALRLRHRDVHHPWELRVGVRHTARAPADGAAVRLVDGDAAGRGRAGGVRPASSPTRIGEIERPADWWSPIFTPGAPRTAVLHRGARRPPTGRPDAFARYAARRRLARRRARLDAAR